MDERMSVGLNECLIEGLNVNGWMNRWMDS